MKSSQAFIPLFFSALAAAAPLHPRAVVTKTDLKVTTEIVYTTVFLPPGQPIPTQEPETPAKIISTAIPQFNEVDPSSTTTSTSSYTPLPVTSEQPAPESTPAQPTTSSSSSPSPPAATGGGSSGGAGSIGEKHDDVRFSAISNYNDPLQPVQKIETWGGCATYGQPAEYQMSDAAGDMRVALDDTVPNFYSYCGKKIRLTNPDGKTAVATIVDKCPKCGSEGGPYSLDLLESVWDAVGGGSYANNVHGASWEIIG